VYDCVRMCTNVYECVRLCTTVYECVLISETHHHHHHCRYTEELYVLSNKEKDRFSSKYLTMTTKVNRISIRGCKAMTGIVANRANSRAVRDLLLLEMVVRSLKGLFRLYMRGCTRMYGVTSEQVRSTMDTATTAGNNDEQRCTTMHNDANTDQH
jgi:hypothetical protein